MEIEKFDKIVFCHKEHIDKLFGGIRIFDNSNKFVLSQLSLEFVDVPLEQTNSRWVRAWRTIKGIFKNYTDRDYLTIVSHFDSSKKVLLFVSHSQYGTLIKRIKKKYPFVLIATYFHNIEITMAYNRLIYYKKPLPLFEIIRDFRSERLVSKYSDKIYLLNAREQSLFEKYYSKRSVHICSVALPDRIPNFVPKQPKQNLKLLFVGTYFWGNIPGLVTFVNDVIPYVDAELFIVGKDMEKIRGDINHDFSNVHYIGRVSDEVLADYYKMCDVFIAPITAGGGMKTKVAEAMMYGLPIIGTKEAFCGYDILVDQIGYCSDNINEYKDYIVKIDGDRERITKMSSYARNCYLNYYSENSALNIYSTTLLKI